MSLMRIWQIPFGNLSRENLRRVRQSAVKEVDWLKILAEGISVKRRRLVWKQRGISYGAI